MTFFYYLHMVEEISWLNWRFHTFYFNLGGKKLPCAIGLEACSLFHNLPSSWSHYSWLLPSLPSFFQRQTQGIKDDPWEEGEKQDEMEFKVSWGMRAPFTTVFMQDFSLADLPFPNKSWSYVNHATIRLSNIFVRLPSAIHECRK